MARRLFVHSGLHKTATTALQLSLSEHADDLRAAGVVYPEAGRLSPLSGHHNIAWQLARDRRFDERFGTLETLFGELARSDGDAIVSSEDFEGVLSRPQSWAALLDLADQAGLAPVMIVYLRDQASYLESLYREMLKHGFGEEFAVYLEEALEHGSIRLKEWIFHFEYGAIVRAMSSVRGIEIRFRNYHSLTDGSITADFLGAIDIPQAADFTEDRVNQRDGVIDSLTNFYRNRAGRPLRESEISVIGELGSRAGGQPTAAESLRSRVRERFATSNGEICAAYGLDRTGLTDFAPKPAAEPVARVEKFFSFETQALISHIAHLIEENTPIYAPEPEALLDRWQAWVHTD